MLRQAVNSLWTTALSRRSLWLALTSRFLQRYTRKLSARPDALIAARLIQTGYIRLADTTEIGLPLEDVQHYQLGQGESEALTLTVRLGTGTVMVTDDFLALIIAHRLGISCQLFLDFVIGRAARGELPLVEAQQIVHAVSPRYPVGFVLHSLAMLRRLQS
jgi:hypothetical protein